MQSRGLNSRKIFSSIILIFVGLIGFCLYRLYQNQLTLKENLIEIESKQQAFALEEATRPTIVAPPIIPVDSKSAWIDVQRTIKDSVVQVLVTFAKFNWLQPWKSPEQGASSGSGFFINADGHFVSNFHVIEDASSIYVQIPSLGQEQFEAEVIGVNPERDISLLKLKADSIERVKEKLGTIPFLGFGNSDTIVRGQEILALGYPLGTQTLKSTQGIVSGREHTPGHPYGYIQITAPLNPGNSGGPAVNTLGEVLGINTAGVLLAQNVGYIIPINEVQAALKDLYNIRLLRKPFLGGVFIAASPDTINFLKNPTPGGFYVAKVFKDSILAKAGVKDGDMLYEINGFKLDRFGDVSVPWSEDKVSMLELLNRYKVGDKLNLTIYRNGTKVNVGFELRMATLPPVRQVYPGYEKIDYETIGGIVVMEITMNHVALLLERAPQLLKYRKFEKQYEPGLIVTHLFANSEAHKSRSFSCGSIIQEVNDKPVKTLEEFRRAIKEINNPGYITFRIQDPAVDKLFVALPLGKVLAGEEALSLKYFYPKSKIVDEMIANEKAGK